MLAGSVEGTKMELKGLKVLQYGSDLSFEVWSHL